MPSKKVASAYVDLQLQTAQFKAAIGEATGEMRKFSAQAKEEMAKSRESVKLLNEELGVGIPRGLQKIIATSPAVASAMNAAFDAVVVFALLHTVVEVTEKIIEFSHRSEEAAAKHAAMWEQAGRSMRNTNDDLDLTNTKLENAIAKLEHKPQNMMKEAIEEAEVAADKLGEKLANDAKLISDTLKGEEAGLLDSFLGQRGSGDVTEIGRKRQFALDATDASNAPPEMKKAQSLFAQGTTLIEAQELLKETQAQQALMEKVKQLPGGGIFAEDFSQKIDALNLLINSAQKDIELVTKTDKNTELTDKKDKLTAAIEAQKQADQARLKQFQTDFDAEKNMFGMTVSQERNFWSARLDAFKQGSDEYMSVLAKFTQASTQLHGEFEKIRKEAVKQEMDIPAIGFHVDYAPQQYDALNAAVAKSQEQQAAFAASLAETTAKLKEQNGQLTPHQAALAAAAAHTADYDAKLKALQQQLSELNDQQAFFVGMGQEDPGVAAKQQTTRNQIAALGNDRQIQVITDQQIQKATTLKGGLDSLFDEFERRTEDVSKLISQTLNQAINTVNDTIIKTLTTRNNRGDWSEAGKSIFTGVAKTGLETAEGGVMKALGLGTKLGGSASNPIYARIVGGLATAGSAISSAASTAANTTGGFFSSLFSGLAKFGGFMEDGGVTSPGNWYMAGESGPELLQVGSTSRIYNARDTANMMGGKGDTHHHWNIDARGSTDPAAVYASATRAIKNNAAGLVAASNASNSDRQRRMPTSSRR